MTLASLLAIILLPSELLERLTAQIVPFAGTPPGVGLLLFYFADLGIAPNGPLDGQKLVLDAVPILRKKKLSEFLISNPRVAPVAAFVLAIVATLLVAVSVERANRLEKRIAVTEQVTALGQDLERRAAATQAYLVSGAALFGSGLDVDQATFDRFAATLQSDKDYQGILALGWSERVPAAQLGGFVRAVLAQGMPSHQVWPKPRGAQGPVDTIKYIAPLSPINRRLLGFNMHSEPSRAAAMDRAELTGKPAITGLVRAVQFGTEAPRFVFLMYTPVFADGPGGAGQSAVKGFIFSTMRGEEFIMASVTHLAASKLDLEIYDEAETPSRLLFHKGSAIADGQAVTSRITIADHEWIVKSAALPANVLSQTGMLILLAGLIIAALLLFIVRLAIQQALFDRQQLLVRQEQDAIRATLTRELNHRIKNTLANVLSILSLSRRNATDLDSFVQIFDGRVRALSATHNLLMQTSWGPTSVVQVIHTEMAPYFENDPPRIALEGPDAMIAPNDALSLGLLIHELVTNAAKYGALSNASGTVALTWDFTEGHRLLFSWREEGGPPPPTDRRRGFGSDLIEKVISRELHSDIKLEFAATGVRVSFAVPIRQVGAFALRKDGPV